MDRMWLLDANISHHVRSVLAAVGVEAKTAQELGWAELRNGELVAEAVRGGFTCLLTQDVLFVESAAKTLKVHPSFAVVLVKIKQQRGRTYRDAFRQHLASSPIQPIAGELLLWPP